MALCFHLLVLQNQRQRPNVSLRFFTKLLFVEMMKPVDQCASGLTAQNKIDKLKPAMTYSCPLGIFPIVVDVMNSRLLGKLRVAEP